MTSCKGTSHANAQYSTCIKQAWRSLACSLLHLHCLVQSLFTAIDPTLPIQSQHTTIMNNKSTAASKMPTWLVDLQSQALKECPNFSLSDEFRKIHEAKARGEDPLKTIYHISGEDLEKQSMVKRMTNLQGQAAENRGRPSASGEQRPSVSDEPGDEEARTTRPLTKVQKRKLSKSPVGRPLKTPQKASKTPQSGFVPAEESVAESSKASAARKPSSALDRPAAEHWWSTEVPKSEVETVYEPKGLPDWYVSLSCCPAQYVTN